MSEFIYILENTLMPGLVKMGRTERSVSERVGELSSHTGVPASFTVAKQFAVENSAEAETMFMSLAAQNNHLFYELTPAC